METGLLQRFVDSNLKNILASVQVPMVNTVHETLHSFNEDPLIRNITQACPTYVLEECSCSPMLMESPIQHMITDGTRR